MSVSDIYNVLAQNISNSIVEDWINAKLNIEASNDWAKTYGKYESITGDIKDINVDRFDDLLNFDIMELHEITTEGGNNRWNRAVFELWSDGKFDMEFIWDQELHDEIEVYNKK